MATEKTPRELELEKQLAAAEKEKNALARNLEKTQGKVKDLTEELAVKDATKGSDLPVVKVNGRSYQFVAPRFKAKHEGKFQEFTAEAAAENAALCAYLVEKGSGVIKDVTPKKD